MSDEDLRALERRALEGDPDAEERLYRELDRRGDLVAIQRRVEEALGRVQSDAPTGKLSPRDVAVALSAPESHVQSGVARTGEQTFVAVHVERDVVSARFMRGDDDGLRAFVARDPEERAPGPDEVHLVLSRAAVRAWRRWYDESTSTVSLGAGTLESMRTNHARLRRDGGLAPRTTADAVAGALEALVRRGLAAGAGSLTVVRTARGHYSVRDDGVGVCLALRDAAFWRQVLELGRSVPRRRRTERDPVRASNHFPELLPGWAVAIRQSEGSSPPSLCAGKTWRSIASTRAPSRVASSSRQSRTSRARS